VRYYFAFVGIALLGTAGWMFWRRVALLAHGLATTGRIESYEARDLGDTVSYHPVVSFTDHQGRRRKFTSAAGRSSRTPPIGSAVAVRYERNDPEGAMVSTFLHMWAAPWALAVLGVASLLAYARA
jgi:hypothetical protein